MPLENKRHHIPKNEIKATFNMFIQNLESNINIAKQLLEVDEVTYSYDELDKFASIYKSIIKTPEVHGLSYEKLLDVFFAYFGEAWIHYFGGEWAVATYIKDMDYSYPCIYKTGPKKNDSICPANKAYAIERKDEIVISQYIRDKDRIYKTFEIFQ